MAPKAPQKPPPRFWLASSPGKRWTELFFLLYSPFWIIWALGILVPFKLYEDLNEAGYMAVGLAAALPCVVLPALLHGSHEKGKSWDQRYWVKANVWIAIFSFIGNYFWTHYFYELLGAQYTFPSWELNKVPIPLYFMTHAYFCFYHTISNMAIRATRHFTAKHRALVQHLSTALTIFLLSYATAYMETLTISHFPYYKFKNVPDLREIPPLQDRARMYSVGSLFYAIYFFVSFPVFYVMDETPRHKWTLLMAASSALAAGMLVTVLLDLWRLGIGPLESGPISGTRTEAKVLDALANTAKTRLPWM